MGGGIQICFFFFFFFFLGGGGEQGIGWAYRGLTGGVFLLQNFSVAISVSPHFCFILVLILISMFLR